MGLEGVGAEDLAAVGVMGTEAADAMGVGGSALLLKTAAVPAAAELADLNEPGALLPTAVPSAHGDVWGKGRALMGVAGGQGASGVGICTCNLLMSAGDVRGEGDVGCGLKGRCGDPGVSASRV